MGLGRLARTLGKGIGKGITWPVRAAKRKVENAVANRVIRHLASGVATLLVAYGLLGDAQTSQFIDGAAEVIGGLLFLWSLYASHRNEQKVKEDR